MDFKPILSSDKTPVAEFLHNNLFHKISVAQWIEGLFPPWSEEFSNHGYMMLEGSEIVGVMIVIYSKIMINGKEEIFGNLSSWCVMEQHRKGINSIMLLKKCISEKNVNYTTTTPNETSQNVISKLGFELIDNSIYLILNLPFPFSKSKILTDPETIKATLDPSTLRIYKDHLHISWLKHLVVKDHDEFCYVIYRDWKMQHSTHLKNSRILFLSNPRVFHKYLLALRGFFFSSGYPATTVNKRFLLHKPFLAYSRQKSKPVGYRAATVPKEAFTNAYTQVMTFEAYY